MKALSFSAVLFLIAAPVTRAELSMAPIFGDHMVLQREREVPVWGIADRGESVTVRYNGQEKTGKTNPSGRWEVKLDAMHADARGGEMTVSSGDEEVVFDDVLVGDVWICSGQSNMAWTLSKCVDADAEVAAAKEHKLRLNTPKGWVACSPEVAGSFSGVAYFFGRKLYEENEVPVGLIARAVGGTPVEWWTPLEKLGQVEFAKKLLENPSEEWVEYQKAVKAWQAKVKAEGRKAAGKKPAGPGKATSEAGVLSGIYAKGKPGSLYAQHLAPIKGYGIRGAIWYQGERNSKAGVEASKAYRELLANMITSWREEWGQGNFPFLAVQLPMFSGGGEGWEIVQESQAAAVGDVPNAGYVDIRDLPDDGLHPKNKKPVGERLAELALEKFMD